MKTKLLFCIFFLFLYSQLGFSLTREITIYSPGTLSKELGKKEFITHLSVSGNISEIDLQIYKELPRLIKLDFSKAHSVNINLSKNCFKDMNISQLILPYNISYLGANAFENSKLDSALIIPPGVKTIPLNAFKNYEGDVILPEGLNSISSSAFYLSKIKKIIIPSTVTSIQSSAFALCRNLSEIICYNHKLPNLGAGIFYGVDKNKCILKVPRNMVDIYRNTNQWNEFQNIKIEPRPIEKLTFRLILKVHGYYQTDNGAGDQIGPNPPAGIPAVTVPEIFSEYKGTRIGEYYWTDVFDMDVPNFAYWTTHISRMARYPVTQDYFDLYLRQIHIDYDRFIPNLNDFNKYYGRYYDRITADTYMSGLWGLMYEGVNWDMTKELVLPAHVKEEQNIVGPGWKKPDNKDYRQLFGMCPFLTEDDDTLKELDVRAALSYRAQENPLAYDINNWSGTPYKTYWFDGYNTNMYGFNMMPGGARLHAKDATWSNGSKGDINYLAGTPWEHMTTRTVDYNNQEWWKGPAGGFFLLFYTACYQTEEGQIIIHDRIDTANMMDRQDRIDDGEVIRDDNDYGKKQYAAMNMRWCRRLTDEELGYKLFIKVNNINRNSKEWTKFVNDKNEIPLLKQVKKGRYSPNDFSIVKIDNPNATAPSGYVELPSGYIRGFYVQYFIQNPNSNRTVRDVILYASKVNDNALDYQQNTIRANNATDIEGINNDDKIKIYPNPVIDLLNIDYTDKITNVSIYNNTGSLVLKTQSFNNKVDISNLSKGIYSIKVETANKNYTQKFIKN